ncbi:MAG TPA: non-homologous end-joining DNA ligase [Pseudonocardiaceae bacterium]
MAVDTTVDLAGRRLKLTNLDKVLYPSDGFTKSEVVRYYAETASVLLPHLRDRPVTLRRYPNGVDGESFFEKNVPRGAPDWVRTTRQPTPSSGTGRETADFVLADDIATLVWLANLAALELHVPQWTVGPRGGRCCPDLLVFDLDPGEKASIVECCRVATLIRDELGEDGLTSLPKTSGSKGLQLYVAVKVSHPDDTSAYARALAGRLARRYPDRVVATMAKDERRGRVLIDWSQNNLAKTTIAPYSLRARSRPTVSTPVTWHEVETCRTPDDLVFTARDIPGRLKEHGDLFEPLHGDHHRLPALAD